MTGENRERIDEYCVVIAPGNALLHSRTIGCAEEAFAFFQRFGVDFGCRRNNASGIELHLDCGAVYVEFLDLDILQSLEIITGGVPHLQLTVEKF